MKKTLYLLAASMLFAASPALAQNTITIGFTASQTGALNNDSTAQMRGIELWRDDVNAKGGIKVGGKSYTVKLVTYDDESQNTRVQQLYTRLITQDKAQFLISPYSSGLVATAAIIDTRIRPPPRQRRAVARARYASVRASLRPPERGQA